MIKRALNHLRHLIDIDTRMGARGETRAARYLSTQLSSHQISNRLVEPLSGQGSITARIPGTRADCLLLLCHLDTADYDASQWRIPPDRATVTPRYIGGRGALDCKGLTAIWLAILEEIVRTGQTPRRTILFAATADEENGGENGLQYLTECTDLLDRTTLVLSEGGGYPVPLDGQTLFTLQTGEVIEPARTPPPEREEILQQGLQLRYYSERTLTYARRAPEITDGRRIAPEAFAEDAWPRISAPGPDHAGYPRLYRMVDRILQKQNPSYACLPFITPGYSDNRYFRQAGIDTLGFFPLAPDNPISGIHGVDECLTMASLHLACQTLFQLVWTLTMEE